MATLKNVRISATTGEVEYFFPMELTPETRRDYRELIEMKGYDVGTGMIGNRSFHAAFVPVTQEQYYDLMHDELRAQDDAKRDARCIIGDEKGVAKICPRKVPNPDYVEGGKMPKTIMVKCEDCPYDRSFKHHPGLFVLFSNVVDEDDDGEIPTYDPASPWAYLEGERYIRLCRGFIDYVRQHKPKYTALAVLLASEYTQVEAAEELGKPATTINYQMKALRKLLMEYLQTVCC